MSVAFYKLAERVLRAVNTLLKQARNKCFTVYKERGEEGKVEQFIRYYDFVMEKEKIPKEVMVIFIYLNSYLGIIE
jgi:hypothetical protein